MNRKAIGAISLIALMFLFIAPIAVRADTTVQHPKVVVYGTVTKDVYVGRSIFEYKDDDGLSSVLPFERQEQNITINFADIVFENAFENKSIAKAAETVAHNMTVNKDVLMEDGIEYIYLKMENSSILKPNTAYSSYWKLNVANEPSITNNYYIMVTGKVKGTGANLATWYLTVVFYFKDSGATEREIRIRISGSNGIDGTLSGTNYVTYTTYNRDNVFVTLQFKIQDLLDAESKTWSLVKLTRVQYTLALSTGSTLDPSTMLEGWIRCAMVNPSRIYIDDGSADGLTVNGTSGQFPPEAGDVINIYGANAEKIVDVAIPFEYEVPYETQTDGKNLIIQYTWDYTHPKSPETGDQLTFANTNMTLYGYKDGVYLSLIHI